MRYSTYSQRYILHLKNDPEGLSRQRRLSLFIKATGFAEITTESRNSKFLETCTIERLDHCSLWKDEHDKYFLLNEPYGLTCPKHDNSIAIPVPITLAPYGGGPFLMDQNVIPDTRSWLFTHEGNYPDLCRVERSLQLAAIREPKRWNEV